MTPLDFGIVITALPLCAAMVAYIGRLRAETAAIEAEIEKMLAR